MQNGALMVWGGWEGHEPRQCAEMIASSLRSSGLDVTISDRLESLESAHRYRVVVPCWTMGELEPAQERSLLEAVEAGTGIAGWHGGMGDAFRSNTAYQFMVGGQFVAHPGGSRRYRVDCLDLDHPITRGIGSFEVDTEQYYMHFDPSNAVLASTTFSETGCGWIDGVTIPVVWTRGWGEGRVAYCALGHDASDLEVREVRELIVRCVFWAARFERDD